MKQNEADNSLFLYRRNPIKSNTDAHVGDGDHCSLCLIAFVSFNHV